MAKHIRQSKSSSGHGKDGPPAYTDPAWAEFWRVRGWTAPDRAKWTDPFRDRRLFLYASSLRDKFGFVRFVGLPAQGGPEDTPIESLFVEPALSPERIDPNRHVKDWPKSSSLIDAVIDHPRLIVLGDPGSGKSTLVSWLVLSLLARDENRLKNAVGALVPITLVLRDLDISGEVTWEKLLARFVAHPNGQALGSPEAIEPLLMRGQVMVLVDGLDEAGNTEYRRAIVKELQAAFELYPEVRWVITSRIVGYEEAAIENDRRAPFDTSVDTFPGAELATRRYVVPFDDARIAMFVRSWHDQHETNRTERSLRSAELLAALERSPQVQGLARIPNLLTMIALVYRVYVHLPDGRARLYERIVQAYLETIETARKLPTPGHTLEDMKRWLGYAAFQMQRARFSKQGEDSKGHGILTSRSDLIQRIVFAMAKGNAEIFEQYRPTAVAFVDWVARRAGLIIPRSDDLFAFTHLSFQEYFAACFIAEQITGPTWNKPTRKSSPLASGTDLAALRSACADTRWHETIVLLFELLAVRGEWADEIVDQLFSLGDDDSWAAFPAKHSSTDARVTPVALLVLLAHDQHSGLSAETRAMAFQRGWLSLGQHCRWMRESGQYFQSQIANALLQSDDAATLRALAVLRSPPKPFFLEVLVFYEGFTQLVAKEFSQCDLTLSKLTELSLANHDVTDAVLKELSRSGTALVSLRKLSLANAPITEVGLRELARADTGLKALTSLDFDATQKIAKAAVTEIKARFPD